MNKTAARIQDPQITTDGFRLTDLLRYVQSAIECSSGPDKHLVKWDGNAYIIARMGPFEIRNWHIPYEIEENNCRERRDWSMYAKLLPSGIVEVEVTTSLYDAVEASRNFVEHFDREVHEWQMKLTRESGGGQDVEVKRGNYSVRILISPPPIVPGRD